MVERSRPRDIFVLNCVDAFAMYEFFGRSQNIELRKTFVFAKPKKAKKKLHAQILYPLTAADLYRLGPLSYVFVRVCRCLVSSLCLFMSICEYVFVCVCVCYVSVWLCISVFVCVCVCVCDCVPVTVSV